MRGHQHGATHQYPLEAVATYRRHFMLTCALYADVTIYSTGLHYESRYQQTHWKPRWSDLNHSLVSGYSQPRDVVRARVCARVRVCASVCVLSGGHPLYFPCNQVQHFAATCFLPSFLPPPLPSFLLCSYSTPPMGSSTEAFDERSPMELVASDEETAEMLKKNPEQDVLIWVSAMRNSSAQSPRLANLPYQLTKTGTNNSVAVTLFPAAAAAVPPPPATTKLKHRGRGGSRNSQPTSAACTTRTRTRRSTTAKRCGASVVVPNLQLYCQR